MKRGCIILSVLLMSIPWCAKAQDPAYPIAMMLPQNIIRMEYFIDNDPGVGLATDISISSEVDISNLISTINTTGLSIGAHRIQVRSLNQEGEWSITTSAFFYVGEPNDQATSALPMDIVKAEYFIDDDDPGFGVANNIALSAGINIANVVATINTIGLDVGAHRVQIRSLNQEGKWSITSSAFFYVGEPSYLAGSTAPLSVVQAEYCIDQDLGFGQGIPITLNPGEDIPSLLASIGSADLIQGVHRLYLRTRNAEGEWSITTIRDFIISDDYAYPSLPSELDNLTKLEYFFDIDPGFDNGIPITLASSANINNMTVAIATANVSPGHHTLYIRSKDDWSMTSSKPVEVIANWYKDTDMDGYGNTDSVLVSSVQPNGYVLNKNDCDDNDVHEYPGQIWYIDQDNDGYGSDSMHQCERPMFGKLLPALMGNGLDDCDDTNPLEYPGLIWYIDQDNDGYGSDSMHQCERPMFGKLFSDLLGSGLDDCDDIQANINPGMPEVCDALDMDEDCNTLADNNDDNAIGKSTYYKDNDNDGFGSFSIDTLVCDAPPMYISNGQDCNDNNANLALDCGKYKVGINTTSPKAVLHVADSSVVFTGFNTLPVLPRDPPIVGSGNRFMWYPDKAALQIGGVLSGNWAKDSIGTHSFTSGFDNKSKGRFSAALGLSNDAIGQGSLTTGSNNSVSGNYASSFGKENLVLGDYATAMGETNIVSGIGGFASGHNNQAVGKRSFTSGIYNNSSADYTVSFGFNNIVKAQSALFIGYSSDTILSAIENSMNPSNPLFVIGRGYGKNAITVLGNGHLGLNNSGPKTPLHLKAIDGNHNKVQLRLEGISNSINTGLIAYVGDTLIFKTTGSEDKIIYKNAINENLLEINKDSIYVKNSIDIGSSLMLNSPDTILVKSDGQAINVQHSNINLISNTVGNTTPSIVLNGSKIGQIIYLSVINSGSNGIKILDGTSNVNSDGDIDLFEKDILKLIWNGVAWLQIKYSKNN